MGASPHLNAEFEFAVEFAVFFEELFVVPFEEDGPGGIAEGRRQIFESPRLEDQSVNTGMVDRPNGIFEASCPGEEYSRRSRCDLADPFQKLHPRRIRKVQIGHEHIDVRFGECGPCFRRRTCGENVKFRFELFGEEGKDARFVVDD